MSVVVTDFVYLAYFMGCKVRERVETVFTQHICNLPSCNSHHYNSDWMLRCGLSYHLFEVIQYSYGGGQVNVDHRYDQIWLVESTIIFRNSCR